MSTPSDIAALHAATERDTPWFTLKGLKTKGKVVQVYDGDSTHVAVFLYGRLYKVACRMMLYDSPEIKDGHIDAIHAKNALIYETTGLDVPASIDKNEKILDVEFYGKDKWGRELVKLYDEYGCINDRLLSMPFNLAYNGVGKRPLHISLPVNSIE